jgi:hypothetical protein
VAGKQTWWPMEQNQDPEIKPHNYSLLIFEKDIFKQWNIIQQ